MMESLTNKLAEEAMVIIGEVSETAVQHSRERKEREGRDQSKAQKKEGKRRKENS